jgi:toxin-antitoxin system PIN domain toxin
MIALDTNILVYSVREDSPWHAAALSCVRGVAEGSALWAIAWPCVHEFLAVITHPKIYKPPTPLQDAIQQVDFWMESPGLRLIGEPPDYWDHLKSTLLRGKITGPLVHDARVAAICRASGVREIWTADRDYSRFAGIPASNPLVPNR